MAGVGGAVAAVGARYGLPVRAAWAAAAAATATAANNGGGDEERARTGKDAGGRGGETRPREEGKGAGEEERGGTGRD